jgi:Phospholipase_D-nuclease N-terminal
MPPFVIVILVLAAIFVGFCLFDLVRQPTVKHLPRWLWAVITIVSVPLGGILYLTLGRMNT